MRAYALALLLFAAAASAAAQDWVVGGEVSQSTGHTYLTHSSSSPFGPQRALVYWQTVDYLWYDAADGRVTSPGLGAGALVRWTTRDTLADLGGGFEVRRTHRAPTGGLATDTTEHGPVVQGSLATHLSPAVTGSIAARYSDANRWTTTGADLRWRISDSLRVGPQAIWQGNRDIRVIEAGGVIEIPYEHNALQIRAGQARIEPRGGLRETKPYISVGVVRSF